MSQKSWRVYLTEDDEQRIFRLESTKVFPKFDTCLTEKERKRFNKYLQKAIEILTVKSIIN